MKIAGATVNQTPLDWKNNSNNITQAIQQAIKSDVHIVCFPELAITAYGCEDLFLSEWLSARAWEELEKIVSECAKITVCVGLPVRIDQKTYNGVAVIQDKTIKGIVLKQNLAKDGVHYEHRWFEPWTPNTVITLERNGNKIPTGDLIFSESNITFGFEICEDAWRTIRPGENLCKRGVDLIMNPSASHFAMEKSVLREELVVNSATRFNCTYLYVNMLGNEAGRMIYDGDIIVAQKGKLIGVDERLTFKPYRLFAAEIDFQEHTKTKEIPSVDNKEKNEEFTRAVSLALYDYLRKSKAKGFTLSLSGGADSSACAVLVHEMIKRATQQLGWGAFCTSLGLKEEYTQHDVMITTGLLLHCAYQSSDNSSEQTLHAAQSLASALGATFHSWSIAEEVSTYSKKIETTLKRKLNWDTDDIGLQNIQARSRSPIIWMLANTTGTILLTTSNRSEADVGYATMDGDTSGSLAPIAGVSKVFLLQWLKWAEHHLPCAGLNAVNQLQPTAELRPKENKQTDEDDLMPYAVLEKIERLAIFERKSPTSVYLDLQTEVQDAALRKSYIKKFFKLWAQNQWKRERYAPSFHLDAWNVDPRSWCRFPILSGSFREELEALDNLK